ncbi:WD40 repeat domain-containing protein [Zavarzinia sp. CC-PAN008]|uniref:WD40 repeat domain-containing protein n=1 Tax=Zavarzinia sp. CC-PAN008 TaxID=3243332 RepID=UPI003F744D60
MSTVAEAQDQAVRRYTYNGEISGLAWTRDGSVAGVALSDGTLRLIGPEGEVAAVEHAGAILALAPDSSRDGLLTGGDDGRVMLVRPGAAPQVVGEAKRTWIGALATHPAGGRVAATGKTVRLVADQGFGAESAAHPSTVTALAINAKGKRLAAAHYGGLSLWWAGGLSGTPLGLKWKGSHIAATWSPDGTYVVSATQENELHGWRLPEGKDFRMSGYAGSTRSLSWTADGRFLACSGASILTLWDFSGKGPQGRPPRELEAGDHGLIVEVACHPLLPLATVAFEDGTIAAGRTDQQRLSMVNRLDGRPVALAWRPDGGAMAAVSEAGEVLILDLAAG